MADDDSAALRRELLDAIERGRTDRRAGEDVTACPYDADQRTLREFYLRGYVAEGRKLRRQLRYA